MPVCVDYYLGEERVKACSDIRDVELPVALRNGGIALIQWGAATDEYRLGEHAPGRFLNFPKGHHIPLQVLHEDFTWGDRYPTPVKIAVAHFKVSWPFGHPIDSRLLNPWIELKPRQFLQGALLNLGIWGARVYIVTVPPPPKYADISCPWPRIVERQPAYLASRRPLEHDK